MHADSQAHVVVLGPGGGVHRTLDRERALERRRRLFEDGEDIVPAGGNLVATRRAHSGSHQAADIGEQGCVSILEAPEQLGRALRSVRRNVTWPFGSRRCGSSCALMKPMGMIPCFLAALSSRLRARSLAASSSKATWLKRARALRTCTASLIGRRRLPLESM